MQRLIGTSARHIARRRATPFIIGTAILGAAILAGPVVVLGSHSATVHISASTTGSSASISVVRDGWGAVVSVVVRDTTADGNCAFAKVVLVVSGGGDPSKRSENCHGKGTVLRAHYRLSPGLGTAISAVRLEACRNRPWRSDNCTKRTVTLPQMFAHATASRIAATSEIMNLPLSQFQTLKDAAPAPYDWSDDGCSVPSWAYHFAFNDACERHDFGYRNFGGSRAYLPSDARRASVDSRFLADLQHICDGYSWLVRPACRLEANAGYGLVHYGGGSAFFD